jgi:Reverse transcriptase (RNA-dependent DNA polymerase)
MYTAQQIQCKHNSFKAQFINTYTKSSTYICCLDVCKAFDRVNHFALLSCMLRRGVPRVLVDIFMSWFGNLSGQVRWGSHLSQSFAICSGLPQGSLLSPKFYNFVMDSILHSLQNSGGGCYVNAAFAGALAYADDLVLLSASLMGLQKLLDVCAEVAAMYDIIFNVDKSVAGFVGDKLSACIRTSGKIIVMG